MLTCCRLRAVTGNDAGGLKDVGEQLPKRIFLKIQRDAELVQSGRGGSVHDVTHTHTHLKLLHVWMCSNVQDLHTFNICGFLFTEVKITWIVT